MTYSPRRFWLHFGLLILSTLAAANLSARSESWTDTQGNEFRGEPIELLGPYALFRTEQSGRPEPLNLLKPEDCVRFYRAVEKKTGPAETWAKAKGELANELVDRLLVPEGDRLPEFDFKANPEPEFIIAFYVDQNEEAQRLMVASAIQPYQNLKKRFGSKVEAVFFGVKQTRMDHAGIARFMKMPWPITDMDHQDDLRILSRFAPDGYGIVIFSRGGEVLFSEVSPHEAETKAVLEKLTGMMDLLRPENPKSWGARAYFWSAVQQKLFASGHSDPVLVGNPLIPEGLKERKIYRLDADVTVSAEGKITDVKVIPNPQLPVKLMAPLAAGLKRALFVPAVENGKFVDGTYHYHFDANP